MMILNSLIFWFVTPFLIGGIIGAFSSISFFKIYDYVVSIKELNKREVTFINKQNCIAKNYNDGNYNRISIKDFVAEEKGEVYVGNYNTSNKQFTNVSKVNYESINADLNYQLKKENIVIW